MIHPHAVVDVPIDNIGAGTKVWQFASVIRGAKIGRECTVAAYALVDSAHVGDNCLISSGAQLHPGTRVGSGVFIGPGAIFCNDRWPRVAKDCFDSEALLEGSFITVLVEAGVSLGAGVIVLPGVRIGKGTVVAAGARVAKSVPPYSIYKCDGSIVPISPRKAERMREAV